MSSRPDVDKGTSVTDNPATTADSLFLELHFYAGGLRREHFPASQPRPPWAPAADRVGFSDEFLLKDGDYAIEWCRLLANDGPVSWLAVYVAAIDARHGDRRNHAGIGLWLRGHVDFDAAPFLKSLALMLDASELPKGVMDLDLTRKLTEFLPWCRNRFRTVPEVFKGPAYGTGTLPVTVRHLVPSGPDAFGTVAQHIAASARLLTPVAANRYVFAVTASRDLPDFAPLPGRDQLDAAIRDSILAHTAEQQAALAASAQRISTLQAALASRDAERQQQADQLAASAREIAVLQSQMSQYVSRPKTLIIDFTKQVLQQLAGLDHKLDAIQDGSQSTVEEIVARLRSQETAIHTVIRQTSPNAMSRQMQPAPFVDQLRPDDRGTENSASQPAGNFWVYIGIVIILLSNFGLLYLALAHN